eukprot:9503839-Pyramimonas_sp.AAC.2
MRNCKAKCTLGERRLAAVVRAFPCSVGKRPETAAGFPAARLATKASAARAAAASEPISRTISTCRYSVRRQSGYCARASRPPT